jgi:hypothetical protein
MTLCHRCTARLMPALLGVAVLLALQPAAGATPRTTPSDRDLADANAEILSAEVALQGGDCATATRRYAAAIQRVEDARLAGRATAIALDCGQVDAAARAACAARARQRRCGCAACAGAGRDRARARRRGRPALRAARHGGGAQGGRAGGDRRSRRAAGAAHAYPLLAASRAPGLEAPASRLALGELALDAWRLKDAARLGAEALAAGADVAAAGPHRARAGLRRREAALAAARAARAADPRGNAFIEVDVLELLGRDEEARTGTEALRDDAAARTQAERRLAIIAFNRAEYADAQQRFAAQLRDPQGAPLAIYYLAAIAERRGDRSVAMRGYALLAGTALESSARHRAARLLAAGNATGRWD